VPAGSLLARVPVSQARDVARPLLAAWAAATERGLGLRGQIAHKGEKAPIQASQRWHVERTNAWHYDFNRFQRCYERREKVINAFFDLADAIITVRSLIRRAWITHRWDTRPARRR
jgi:hypothetical protein